MLTRDEGGRQAPFFSGYRPQFYFRTTDVTGAITLPVGSDLVLPGDHMPISVELVAPVALEPGIRFAVRQGNRTVGVGVVTEVE